MSKFMLSVVTNVLRKVLLGAALCAGVAAVTTIDAPKALAARGDVHVYGTYYDPQEAIDVVYEIRKQGFPDAYCIHYADGRSVVYYTER